VAEWYFIQDDRQIGPVELEQLQQAVASGQVLQTDLVWQKGMPEWLPVKKVPDLGGGKKFGLFGDGKKEEAAGPPGSAPAAGKVRGGGQAGLAKEASNALILAIVSVFCCPIILGPMAVVRANNARSAMQMTGNMAGYPVAIAALIIGIVSTVLGILGILLRFLGVITIGPGFHRGGE